MIAWLKSCWHIIVISLLTLFVLLAILIAFLLSPSGFKTICSAAEWLTNHKLEITNPSGALSHNIYIENIRWQSTDLKADIQNFTTNIKLSHLFSGELNIKNIEATKIEIHQLSTHKKEEAFSLDQFKQSLPKKSPWPSWLSIQHLNISKLTYQKDKDKPLNITGMTIAQTTDAKHTAYKISAETSSAVNSSWQMYLLPLKTKTNIHLLAKLNQNQIDIHGFVNKQQFYLDHATYKQKSGYIDSTLQYHFNSTPSLTLKSQLHNFKLQEKPLSGYLDLGLFAKDQLEVKVNIKSPNRDNNINLNLSHKTTWQASWQIDIPKLQLYTNNIHGSIQSKGSYTNQNISGNGQIDINRLIVSNTDIRHLNSTWEINGENHHRYTSSFSIKQLEQGSNIFHHLVISSSGNSLQQNTHIDFKTPWNQNVSALVKSKYDNQKQTISGTLSKLNIQQSKQQLWQLKHAVQWSANHNEISWTPLTEAYKTYYFNLEGKYAFSDTWKISTKGNFLLKPIALQSDLFKGIAWNFDSSINGQGNHIKQIYLASEATLNLLENTKSNIITHMTLSSQLQYNGKKLTFENKLLNEKNQLGYFNINANPFDLQNIPDFEQIPLSAQLNINLEQKMYAHLLSAFTSGIQSKSALNIQGKFDGTLQKPSVKFTLKQPRAVYIEALNKNLSDTSLTLNTADSINAKLVTHIDNTPITLTGNIKPSKHAYQSTWHLVSKQVEIMHKIDQQFSIIPDITTNCDNLHCVISGQVSVPKGRYQIQPTYGSTTLPSDDITYVHNNTNNQAALTLSNFKLNLGKDIYLTGYGLHAYLAGTLQLNQTPTTPLLLNGQLALHQAYFQFSSDKLHLKVAQVSYTKAPAENPSLQIQAEKTINIYALPNSKQQSGTVTVGLTVSGTLKNPIVNLYSSSPALSQADILSYILFNQPASSASVLSGASLVASLRSGGTQSKNPITLFKQSLGLSEFGIETENNFDSTGNISSSQSQFVAGKHLFKKVYLRYSLGLSNSQNVIMLIYQLSNHWSIQSAQAMQTTQSSDGSTSAHSIDLMYQISSNTLLGWLTKQSD